MSNVDEPLSIFASLVSVCMVIGIGFAILAAGKSLGMQITSSIDQYTTAMSEQPMTKYEGLDVSGAEVVNCVRKMKSSVPVIVRSLSENPNKDYDSFTFSGKSQLLNLPTDAWYVNPTDVYRGAVVRNANEVIVAMRFTQVGGGTVMSPSTGSGTVSGSTPEIDQPATEGVVETGIDVETFTSTMNAITETLKEHSTILESYQILLEDLQNRVASSGDDSDSDDFTTITIRLEQLELSISDLAATLVQIEQAVKDLADLQSVSGVAVATASLERAVEPLATTLSTLDGELSLLSELDEAQSGENAEQIDAMRGTVELVTQSLAAISDELAAMGGTDGE